MTGKVEKLKSVSDFDSLVQYLIDELSWPIEDENINEITFPYKPSELGIRDEHSVKINTIKQIRPLTDNQPWGLFYIDFEPKKLPVVILRRILKALEMKKRPTSDRIKTWNLEDLIFISALGEEEERRMTFAKFIKKENGLEELRTFSWDRNDTELHMKLQTIDLDKLIWPVNENDIDGWRSQWSRAFRFVYRYTITTSQQLSKEMAQLASTIRSHVKEVYGIERPDGPLHKLFSNFKQVLIHDLDIDSFSDMYAQTITYGLFSAKATHEEKFAEDDIVSIIPNTNPFLKDLFRECTKIGEDNELGLDLDELGVTELIDTLKQTDIDKVLSDFGRQQRGEDPVIHFYEEFLKQYDAAQKVERGVFYTPDPVVSFIVRSVDEILKKEFGLKDGLADTSTVKVQQTTPKKTGGGMKTINKEVPKVQILDPAVGTGTFLKYTIENIKKTFYENNKHISKAERKEKWNKYVENDLLSRLYGFELMMAPYAICHLKLGLTLAETGYNFEGNKRLGVYLANTLEGNHEGAGTLDADWNWLANESHAANIIKEKKKIFVVMGNPPYSISSRNKGEWILKLISDFKANLNEKKLNLDDDYIKFIRFGQYLIEKNGEGILVYISNSSFIEGITHRQMRKRLLETFNKIYIIDLHGNSKRKETCPDGSKDENVFDITQGVSINVFIKNSNIKNRNIYHYDIFGLRNRKYNELLLNNIYSIKWETLTPTEPYYFFVPKNFDEIEKYEQGFKIDEIFNVSNSAIKTDRDSLFIDYDKSELQLRMKRLFSGNYDENFIQSYRIIDSGSYKITKKIQNKVFHLKFLRKILYRPFDFRFIYYDNNVISRPAYKVFKNYYSSNYGIITKRGIPYSNLAICSSNLSDIRTWSSPGTQGSEYVFPIYIYSDKNNKIHNLNKSILKKIEDLIGKVTPENVFNYIYAVLYSLTFQEKYKEFLKIDFPRVPYPRDNHFFWSMVRLGSELKQIHLLESPKVTDFITTYSIEGNNVVEKPKYKNKKVWINKKQYFGGVPMVAWEFYIGGYQPAQKWLKDRKGRELSVEDIEHYQKIIVALTETDRIMKEIDKVVEEFGGW